MPSHSHVKPPYGERTETQQTYRIEHRLNFYLIKLWVYSHNSISYLLLFFHTVLLSSHRTKAVRGIPVRYDNGKMWSEFHLFDKFDPCKRDDELNKHRNTEPPLTEIYGGRGNVKIFRFQIPINDFNV